MLKQYCNEIKKAFFENKIAIYISIVIMFISLILGYILADLLTSFLNPVVDDLTQKVQTGVIKLTFNDIFFNNISIVFKMFILGLCFCFSIVILSFNGFFIGYYIAISNNLTKVLLLIVPHGIFEFSSCILACTSGLVLFNFLFKFLKSYWTTELLKESFVANLDKLKQSIILLSISCVLMFIAAIVEVYLTIPIANFILSF